MNNNASFYNLNDKQKVNYVKNLLFNNEINYAIDALFKNEKKDLSVTKVIKLVLKDELIVKRIIDQSNLKDEKTATLFVYSKVLSVLSFYKKTVILSSFLKSLSKDELKDLAVYEYQNKTNVSLEDKTFDKFCSRYKNEALKKLELSDDEIETLDIESEKYNNVTYVKEPKKKNKVIPILVTSVILLFSIVICYKIYSDYKLIKKYDGLILPGIYINEVDLTGNKISDVDDIVEREKNNILNGTITIKNVNEENSYTYSELGVVVKNDDIADEIKKYNKDLSFFKKVSFIKSNKKNKTFNIKATLSDDNLNSFMSSLEEKLNTEAKNDALVIDKDHNVYYDKGAKGFVLDVSKTRSNIKKELNNPKQKSVVEAKGKITKNEIKYEHLSSINKKISSYTTYFANQGNRGHNINLASKRLNNTVVMPGDTFSYLKVVGPYGTANGYLPAPVYINSEVATANGGGVCQLASTLYNAQLRAGLQTVSRRGHTFAPNYVPRGLDATVYSTTTDYKFKNQYEYPIYIVSYIRGNYLTVDMWSNENALGGKTYEPYSVASNGGYLAYLKTIQDGKVIDTKYLDRSVYKVHP